MPEDEKTYQAQFWDMLKGQYPATNDIVCEDGGGMYEQAINDVLKQLFEKIGTDMSQLLIRTLATEGFTKGVLAAKEIKLHIK